MRRQRLRKQRTEFGLRLQIQRHANFARRITNRYAGRSPVWQRPLSMAMVRRIGPQSIVQRHWHRELFHLSPRINLSFISSLQQVVFKPKRPNVLSTILPIRRVMNWLQSPTIVKRIERSIENEILVEHVASRRRRIEVDAEFSTDKPQQKPISKVLRREKGLATQKPDRLKLEATKTMTSPEHRYQSGSSMTAAATPAIDVNQLTDEVIRSIDRRIIAQRERLGRI